MRRVNRIKDRQVRCSSSDRVSTDFWGVGNEIALLFAKHELANKPFNIGGIRFVEDCQSRFAPRAAAMLNSPDYIVGSKMLGDRCKVEHIERLETPTAIEDLFSDDFRWRFQLEGETLNVVP